MKQREYDLIEVVCIVCEFPGMAIKTSRAKIPIDHDHCKGVWRNRKRTERRTPQEGVYITKCYVCKKFANLEILQKYKGRCEECNSIKSQVRQRECLMCNKYFKSSGPGNRRCGKCERIANGLKLEYDRPRNKMQCNNIKYSRFYE